MRRKGTGVGMVGAPWPPLQTSQACPCPLKSHPSVDDTEAATKLTTGGKGGCGDSFY